jgi:hypothetical protein
MISMRCPCPLYRASCTNSGSTWAQVIRGCRSDPRVAIPEAIVAPDGCPTWAFEQPETMPNACLNRCWSGRSPRLRWFCQRSAKPSAQATENCPASWTSRTRPRVGERGSKLSLEPVNSEAEPDHALPGHRRDLVAVIVTKTPRNEPTVVRSAETTQLYRPRAA